MNSKMPYYCTVPRCTSMAGKVKNVSFHQFPRDEELAKAWNKILKRGKPYTKYSKVCSLHFTQEDYIITDSGRNKGQWKTLRKAAVPTQNLPSDSPIYSQKSRNSGTWALDNISSEAMDSQLHQMAQAIYTQTIIAIQASETLSHRMDEMCNEPDKLLNGDDATSGLSNSSCHSSTTKKEIEQLIYINDRKSKSNLDLTKKLENNANVDIVSHKSTKNEHLEKHSMKSTYKCVECSKCFKDPDVYILHKRIHMSKNGVINKNIAKERFPDRMFSEKENLNSNPSNNLICENSTEETLRANPILANLLKSTTPQLLHKGEEMQEFDNKNVKNIENQIMMDLAANRKINNCRNLLIPPNTIIAKENVGLNHDNSNIIEDDFSSVVSSNTEDETLHDIKIVPNHIKIVLGS